MCKVLLSAVTILAILKISYQDMLDKILRSDVWNCKFIVNGKYFQYIWELNGWIVFLISVKTCGVPVIDTSEMGNRSVRLGDKVTFNCKVRKN